MSAIIAAILTSILCFCIHLFVFSTGLIKINPQWCIVKLKRHWQFLLITWLMMIPVFLIILARLDNCQWVIALNNNIILAVYGIFFIGMLFFLYLTVYYVVDRSVSSRLMIEIENSPKKKLTFKQIKGVYHPDTKYENELLGMSQGGFVKKEGDYYINTFKGTVVARVTRWYKETFRLGDGG